MSAGHGHRRLNLRHAQELRKLLTTGGAPELMRRWSRFDHQHDINDVAGYSVDGTVRYLDRDVFRALFHDDYAVHLIGEPIRTGLTPHQTLDCILLHEADEKTVLDADNDID